MTIDEPAWVRRVFSDQEREQIDAALREVYEPPDIAWWNEFPIVADEMLKAAAEINPSLLPIWEAVMDCAPVHAEPLLCGTVMARLLEQRSDDPEVQRLLVGATVLYCKADETDPAAPGDLDWVHVAHRLNDSEVAGDDD